MLSSILTEAELLAAINKNRTVLQPINESNCQKNISALKRVGLTVNHENRIFKYSNGTYKFKNQIPDSTKVNTILPYYKLDLSIPGDNYVIGEQGIVTPIFGIQNKYSFLEDSEYFIFGTKAMVIDSIYGMVEYLSNGQIQSESIVALRRLIPKDVDYIIEKSTNIIYSINGQFLHVSDPRYDIYIKIIDRLDSIKQPWEPSYLIRGYEIDADLLELARRPDAVSMINQILSSVHEDEVFNRLGVKTCVPRSLVFEMTADYNIIKVGAQHEDADISQIWTEIMSCKDDYLILSIGVIFHGLTIQRHQISMVINTITNRGVLLDSCYRVDYEFTPVLRNIVKYMRLKLARLYPGLEIKIMSELPCMLGPLQSIEDKSCIIWSYYMAVLYIINPDLSLDAILELLYGLDRFGIVIPRYLMWIVGKDIVMAMYGEFLESD